jgi:hypothetical protein
MPINRIPLWGFKEMPTGAFPWIWCGNDEATDEAERQLPYTKYHNVDHDVWNRAFAEPELVAWLSSRRRGNRQKAKLALARLPRIIKIVA